MGQFLSALDDCPSSTQSNALGGVWADHEFVVVPLDISDSTGSSTTASTFETNDDTLSIISSAETLASYASAETSAPLPSLRSPSAAGFVPVEYIIRNGGRDHRRSVMVTRTTVRPPNVSSGSTQGERTAASSRVTLPLNKTTRPILKALNCFTNVQAFEPEDEDFMSDTELPMTQPQSGTRRVIEVVVRQTRDEYEDAAAMRKLAAEVYTGRAGHRPVVIRA